MNKLFFVGLMVENIGMAVDKSSIAEIKSPTMMKIVGLFGCDLFKQLKHIKC
ncbi:hypothetical protein [Shewanella algicola]|uniref:hypothetical protein n=1 Tax=Shewanella algicola TaxID=640633 RepID=UPI0024956648|nr:hypothetical protein [Shewanella algicola]